ncbi:glycosyl hydrolase family 65 central catalytic domain-containing protein [Aspergillus ambiguus]|uniref:alpha,alpha-trehalase treA n=1 Tax=Aspergillus ambiguus TaxID=176160 RepID=UPI003CCCA661
MKSAALATLTFLVNVSALSTNGRVTSILKRHGSPSIHQASVNSSNVYQTRFDGVTWDDDNWLLSTTALEQGQFQTRGSVANGYLGINVASVGPFFEVDREDVGDVISGWPLFSRRQTFATISGFFDSQATTDSSNFPWLSQNGHDSVISGVPHWSGLILDLGDGTYLDSTVDNQTISDFRSTYDFKAGLLSWAYTWTPAGNRGSYAITYRLFANKLNVTQAVVDMEIVPSGNANATIVNVLDGESAVRTHFVSSGEDDGALFSSVRPWGISNVTAYIYANLSATPNVDLAARTLVTDMPYVSANDSSIAQAVPVKFTAHEPVRVTKFVGGASTDAFTNPQQTAKQAAAAAQSAGYLRSLRAHASEWAYVMNDQSVDRFTDPHTGQLPDDEHIVNSAIIAVTNTYYLLQNTVSKNAIAAVGNAPLNTQSISVGGLSSDSYAGLIFWDADVWMQPGLVASHPEAAQAVTDYRVAKYDQAIANIDTVSSSSKNQTRFDPSAAIYPWTSGRFGNCTATGPCWDYQYHLNGDIGLSLIYQWVTSGDTQQFRESLFPVYDSVATLYSNLVERNGSSWTITNMTDPDEYANNIDAGGFTMAVVSETLQYANSFREQFGLEPNDTWTQISDNVLILRENGVTLEYTTMNGTAVVKQADIVLTTYPLVYDNYTAQNALNDLDYYANKQSPDGPAMTWAIFSIVASQLSPSGCSAYTYHQYSFDPYMRAPFYQLSEQMIDNATINGGTHPAFPFLTGHGGANQVVLFGYLGLRLLPDDILHVDPNPPPQLPHISYRTFYWRGWPISARSNATHTTLVRTPHVVASPLDTADARFADAPIPVHVGSSSSNSNATGTTYTLHPREPLTIPNRRIGWIATTPGDLAQCQTVSSPDGYESGQFPISVVDGATSTRWQPSSSNASSVTVELAARGGASVSGFHFDWAAAPPVNATVVFHDARIADPPAALAAGDGSYRVVTTLTQIAPSKPYRADSAEFTAVAVPVGNTTDVRLDAPVDAARYATLVISGNQGLGEGEEDVGATVAEWAIVRS